MCARAARKEVSPRSLLPGACHGMGDGAFAYQLGLPHFQPPCPIGPARLAELDRNPRRQLPAGVASTGPRSAYKAPWLLCLIHSVLLQAFTSTRKPSSPQHLHHTAHPTAASPLPLGAPTDPSSRQTGILPYMDAAFDHQGRVKRTPKVGTGKGMFQTRVSSGWVGAPCAVQRVQTSCLDALRALQPRRGRRDPSDGHAAAPAALARRALLLHPRQANKPSHPPTHTH